MSYTTNTLSYLYGGPIEGGWKMWEYTSTDSIATMTAAGYIADATAKGMTIGDFVIAVNQTNPQGYILQVQAIAAAVGNTPGAATLAVPIGLGGNLNQPRNMIEGGDFTTNPWQRGTSFTAIANTLTYTADRFFAVGGASSSISVSQQAVTAIAGFGNALQFGRASTNTNTAVISLGQVIESMDSIRAQGQVVTVSFWALAGANWSPASGNLNVQLASGTGTNQGATNVVAGTWTNQTSITLTPQQGAVAPAANVAQPITTTWARYSFTGAVPAACTQLGVLFNATPVGTAGANDWVQIMGVQIEVGGQPSAFEHMDAEMVLAQCQRFAFNIAEPASGVIISTGMISTTNNESVPINLPVQMIKAPTVTVVAGTFKFNIAGTATAVGGGFAAAATHTPNYITVVGTVTATVGQATLLQGGGGSGSILASADF